MADAPTEIRANRSEITLADRLSASKFYPVCQDGPLCPYLNDPELLMRLLGKGERRKTFKKFSKQRNWKDKPKAPSTMTDDCLKALLYSACNSKDARDEMCQFEDGSSSLGHIVYEAMMVKDLALHEACRKKLTLPTVNQFKQIQIITPEMFGHLMEAHAADEMHREGLHLLALSLAMLKKNQAAKYMEELLCFFPDSAEPMGCLDEEEYRFACESIPEIIDRPSQSAVSIFACAMLRADSMTKELHAVKSAFDEYKTTLNKICAATELSHFADAGPIGSWIKTVTRDRQIVASSADSARKILAEECIHPDGKKCEFSRVQAEYRNCASLQVSEFISLADRASDAAKSVADQRNFDRASLISLVAQQRDYLKQLGRKDGDCNVAIVGELPCVVSEILSVQRKRVQELKLELMAALDRVRTDMFMRLDTIKSLASTVTRSVPIDAEIAEIRRKLLLADDMPAIENCREQIETLETEVGEASFDPDQGGVSDAASRLLNNPGDTKAFLDLCGALNSKGKPDVALLLLVARQSQYPVDEISEDPDRAVGELIQAVCAVGNARRNFNEIWKLASHSPWLAAIGRRDLTATDLIERLAVMYAWNNDEQVSANLMNLGTIDRSDIALPSSVMQMIDAIVSRAPLRVISSVDVTRRESLRQEIEERLAFENGKFRHIQCGKATHFARFEALTVFPKLQDHWLQVSTAIDKGLNSDAIDLARSVVIDEWLERMGKSHDREIQSHPHYSTKIRIFITEFVELVQKYVDELTRFSCSGELRIDESYLKNELSNWAGKNSVRQQLVACIFQKPTVSSTEGAHHSLIEMLLKSQNVIASCPSTVSWSISQRFVEQGPVLESLILEDLHQARPLEEVDEFLVNQAGWTHLRILWENKNTELESHYAKKEHEELLELNTLRSGVSICENGALIDVFDLCCRAGRFKASRAIAADCQEQSFKESATRIEQVKDLMSQKFDELNQVKNIADEQAMSSDWVARIYSLASEIEFPLKQLHRSAVYAGSFDFARLEQLAASLNCLHNIVKERSSNFETVRFHLDGGNLDSIIASNSEIAKQQAEENCPELLGAWSQLSEVSEYRVGPAWVAFAKLFGKLSNLYHDESDTKCRFVPVSPFDYPYSVYQTAFYKPKSEFLKKPLRFYLYRTDVDSQSRQRLDSWLSQEQSAAWLHVIFAPSGADKLRKALQLDKKFRGVLVIDDEFIYRIAAEEKHDVPVRRGLHESVADLISLSPFVSNGYCHEVNNIYVGRGDIIKRLVNSPQAMIWGGRRIGKTSVLHALESILVRKNYRVALVYADVQDSVDPDLAIAKTLAAKLGFSPIESVHDFVRQVQAESKNEVKFAFLLDEADEYIKKSRGFHDGKFPLASALRKIVMEDSTKGTVLVYSGYHQLYFEAKLDKSKKRVGHPFVNIAHEFPIRDLAHDDVIELVKTGFEEMLGIDLHPEVPSLIAKKASRHPAFVQEFCRCLLDHVSLRRSRPQTKLVISPQDVEEVYEADGGGDGGEQPFIFYVDETLGFNLSDLGRSIMLTFDSDEYRSKQEIYKDLRDFAECAEIECPKEDHFSDTIDLLVMTNLLTQDPKATDRYRMTYPTFIDILKRLNKLGKTEIEKSLRGYDQHERNGGILR